MTGWHHQCNGHEPRQTPGGGEGQGGQGYCSPWGCKESEATGGLHTNPRLLGQRPLWVPSLTQRPLVTGGQ